MDCNNFKIKISALIDGEISENEKREIEEHLNSCEQCRKMRETYENLSGSIKVSEEKIPEDFKVKLPAEKRKVISIFRGHEGVVSAIAAAIALIIFAGGISGDKYKTPVVLETTPVADARILKNDEQLPDVTATPETVVADATAQKRNEKSLPEFTPEATAEILPDESTEEKTLSVAEESDDAVLQDGAVPEKVSAGGGGGSSAATAIITNEIDEIINFQMPDISEFADEGVYNYLKEKLLDIQIKAKENSVDIVTEFEELKAEINNAKK